MKASFPLICRQMVRNRGLVPLALSMAYSIVVGFEASAETVLPTVRPLDGVWEPDRKFEFEDKQKKTRRSLSGISCPEHDGAHRTCLVVFDEGTVAHYIKLGSDGYRVVNDELVLRDSDDELDAEGATTDGTYYYVTGSHSPKRSDCRANPGSRHVIRFRVDAETGKAQFKDGKLAEYADTDALWSLMAKLPGLKEHVGDGVCLGTESDASTSLRNRAVNIEGLVAADGKLHFGFRGPAEKGLAPVLSVGANDLFEHSSPPASVTWLDIGDGRGIRDMTAVRDGILILAGPDDDKANNAKGWILAIWDGRARDGATVQLRRLAALDLTGVTLRDCDKELKPEAVTVISDRSDTMEIVILSDGMCDGGPLKFAVPRDR
jgi:hypothetical protein